MSSKKQVKGIRYSSDKLKYLEKYYPNITEITRQFYDYLFKNIDVNKNVNTNNFVNNDVNTYYLTNIVNDIDKKIKDLDYNIMTHEKEVTNSKAEKTRLLNLKSKINEDLKKIEEKNKKESKYKKDICNNVLLLYVTDSINELEINNCLDEGKYKFGCNEFFEYLKEYLEINKDKNIIVYDSKHENKKYGIELTEKQIDDILNKCRTIK